jgi:anaerobic magnesium-protoporphyrin IX monomethyl ester cyclase
VTSVLLIYPFFRPRRDRSRFRFPPLGPAYVAAALREAGHDVELLDCTFLGHDEAVARARASGASVVGVSALATLAPDALWFAERLRGHCDLLVAGGPLPTCEPGPFLTRFDAVVRGEGEATMCELVAAVAAGHDPAGLPGVVTRAGAADGTPAAPASVAPDLALPAPRSRPLAPDLDALPLPARDLLPNAAYIAAARARHSAAVTTVMTTRGCPFACEFCSNVVFGRTYRERSPGKVVDEVEQALALGYDRIAFADDVFTLDRARVRAICDEIARRDLRFAWECLGRADTVDDEVAGRLRAAGCDTVFFGLESGNDDVLRLMDKRITTVQGRAAVAAARRAGLRVGAFFILYYPGETDDTVLDTLRFARSLPLDYVGLSMPYPLPGTRLVERVGRPARQWCQRGGLLGDHSLLFDAGVSATRVRAAIVKGQVEHLIGRWFGPLSPLALRAFAAPTDALLRRVP